MSRGRALAFLALAAATAAVFSPVLQNGFVNWDDPDVLISNPRLRQPLGPLLAWAFTTTHMDHYQPLSWLAYAGLAGAPAAQVHAVSVALHMLNVVLLLWVAARVADRGGGDASQCWAAAAATALFAVHPLRVEPVAWASALPYLLSYAPLLVAVGCWIGWVRGQRPALWWAALGLFAVSQLARVTAPLLPLVLYAVARADRAGRPLPAGALARAVAPFAAIAVPLALIEAGARNMEALGDIGLAPRLAWALGNPGLYLWRTVWPAGLSTLDVLPRAPQPDWGVALLAAISVGILVALTRHFTSTRVVAAVWGGYLLLLLPVLGLTPSGVQATADRYMYGPAMVLTVALAAALAHVSAGPRRLGLVVAGTAAVFFGQAAAAHTAYWHDSVSLWSRAVALDSDNDIALYNLALAQIDAGQPGLAIERLQRLVALVPDHEVGRQRLALLVADREQRAGDAQAAAGHFTAAVAAYDRALDADPTRLRVRGNRGMAHLELDHVTRGAADLDAAVQGGLDDPAITNALAFAWSTTGRAADALGLLRRTLERRPDEQATAGNLARLLVTAEPATLRDPDTALALAAQLNDATGGRDPRVLDTLALALAATGRTRDAAQALDAAIALARDAGDADLTATLAQRRASLPR